jgi:hypothetical protein
LLIHHVFCIVDDISIVAGAAVQLVGPRAAIKEIVVVAGGKRIRAGATDQPVLGPSLRAEIERPVLRAGIGVVLYIGLQLSIGKEDLCLVRFSYAVF